jgi:hypothetical protein
MKESIVRCGQRNYVSRALPLMMVFGAMVGRAQPISHQISLPNTMTWCGDSMIRELFSEINVLRGQRGLP